MGSKRPSRARFFSARFNPATSAEDEQALLFIQQWMDQGYNFKAIVLDAVLARAGHRPEMFAKPNQELLLTRLEDMLADFAEDLIKRLGERSPASGATAEAESGDVTTFSRNFAKGFLHRQKSGRGE